MGIKSRQKTLAIARRDQYAVSLAEVIDLLESARRASAPVVNAVMTATYWQVGRRIVESEQGGASRADYGRASAGTSFQGLVEERWQRFLR
jgi:hypothetical protein